MEGLDEAAQDTRVRRFLSVFGIKAKKYESPRRMAYRKIEEFTKNRRGTRSINTYLDDYIPFMDVCIATHEGMQAAWTAEQKEQFEKQISFINAYLRGKA